MRLLTARLLVLGLVLAMTPGLAEVVENVAHLAVSGHGAHAADQGPDHEPTGDEHGCSGTFHVCSCHSSVPSDLVRPTDGRRSAAPQPVGSIPSPLPSSPILPVPDRPPQA